MSFDQEQLSDNINHLLNKARTVSEQDSQAAMSLLTQAHSLAEQTQDYTIVSDTVLCMVDIYHAMRRYDCVESFSREMIDLCGEHHDDEREMLHTHKLALCYIGISNADSVLLLLLPLLQRMSSLEHTIHYPQTFSLLAVAYRMKGELENAEKMSLQAIHYAVRAGNSISELESRQTLGSIYGQMGKYNEALEQFSTIYLHPQAKKTLRLFLNVCGSLSELYGDMGNSHKSLELAMEGLHAIKNTNTRFIEAILHSHAGRAYVLMGNYTAALNEYLQSKTIRTEIGDKAGIAIINTRLGRLYLEAQEYNEALRYGYEALAYAKEHRFPVNEAYSYLLLGEVFVALVDYEEAMQYLSQSYSCFSILGMLAGLPSLQRNNLYNGLITVHTHRGEHTLAHSYRNELQTIIAQTLDKEHVIENIHQFEQKRTEEKFKLMGLRSVVIPQQKIKTTTPQKIESQHHISICFFGRFRINVNGKDITPEQWKRKRNRDIFKYIALHYKQTIPVEKIIDIFWGYDPPANAANIIWNAASVIRSIFEPDLPKGAPSAYLIAADKSYTLDFGEKADIDFYTFSSLLQKAEKISDIQKRIETIENAIALYEGDLLPEDIYEEWTETKREEYTSYYIVACLECSRYYAEQEKFSLSARYAKKVIAIDNTYRKAYEILVKVCKENGNINEAHRSIAQCKKQYTIEYGEAPPAWLDQLEHSLASVI
ncbi:MAG: tetratricopeptide repeat protein [Ignavibacteria bacterium]|nr:tetratricopeptide repeat protein [Ignavibacteria bacterium]